jgi:hypothetical protein
MHQDSIEFLVGIFVEDDRKLDNFIKYLESCDIPIEIVDHYDDPDGYYTYVMRGSWDTYKEFENFSITKSLSHNYEQ